MSETIRRDLTFVRTIVTQKCGSAWRVEVVSRASNEEGEFIVRQQGGVPFGSRGAVDQLCSLLIDRVRRDENHINAGYGLPIPRLTVWNRLQLLWWRLTGGLAA